MRKKRTEITIEISELVLVKGHRSGPAQIWCQACAEVVAMLTPEQAAMVADVSTRTIYRRIEEGTLHFIEAPGRSLLVCAGSLGATERNGTESGTSREVVWQ